MTSPTQRTLKYLRDMGAEVDIVERRAGRFVTKDFLGFADIIAVFPASIVAVQVTSHSGGNYSARRKKILAEPRALMWLRAGGLIELHGWHKKGPRGKRKLWTLRAEAIVEGDFAV